MATTRSSASSRSQLPAIPNEKYRPAVHALEPVATRSLLDIRSALLARRIEVTPGVDSAHHTLEDGQGVRLFDFHDAENQRLHLVLPPEGTAPLSLSRAAKDGQAIEYEIPASGEPVVKLALLEARPRTVAARGAADNAFRQLFARASSPEAVAEIRIERRDYYTVLDELAEADRERAQERRRFWTRAAWGTAAAAALTALGTGATAGYVAGQDSPDDSQAAVAARNASIQNWRTASIISGGIALSAAVAGTVLQLWPDTDDRATLRASDR